jgi:hypothetical protein
MERGSSVSVAPNGVRDELPNEVCGQNWGMGEEEEMEGRREKGAKKGRLG